MTDDKLENIKFESEHSDKDFFWFIHNKYEDICNNVQKQEKPKELEWYVFYHDFNWRNEGPKHQNIFDLNWVFLRDLYLVYKKYKDNFDMFSKEVKSCLMHHYWSRYEYETYIQEYTDHDPKGRRIDIYDQVMMNWKPFINYLWENKKLISKYRKYTVKK